MKYRLTAKVRKVGAIGIFYPVDFIIDLPDAKEEDGVSQTYKLKQKWFELYSDDWELYHFVSIDEIEKDDKISC